MSSSIFQVLKEGQIQRGFEVRNLVFYLISSLLCNPLSWDAVIILVMNQLFKTKSLEWTFLTLSLKIFSHSKPQSFHSFQALFCVKSSFLVLNRYVHTKKRVPKSYYTEAARNALLEYLHCTRNIPFTDAEHIVNNSPEFLKKILKNVEIDSDIGSSLTRFLRYHPINEFEPFFESVGLNPSELSNLLPPKLMFLSDEELLLHNFHVLCTNGIPRSSVGKIYTGAKEVFGYQTGVLDAKFKAYKDHITLNEFTFAKFVISSPSLLIGSINKDFIQFLDEMKKIKIECECIVHYLSESTCYKWSRINEVLLLFLDLINEEVLREKIRKQPGLVFDNSGKSIILIVVWLVKMGATEDDISRLLVQFPDVKIDKFLKNLQNCFLFFVEIEISPEEIRKILCSHSHLIGTYSLKKVASICCQLSCGKKRLHSIVLNDLHALKNWVLGSKIKPLPRPVREEKISKEKMEFLLKLGLTKDSKEMKKAYALFRGKGEELQERFDCFVKAGLDPSDVSNMVKTRPHILNQSIEVIERKINFLKNNLSYPLKSLVSCPHYIALNIDKVKLRFLMYNWLKEEGIVPSSLSITTLLCYSEKRFETRLLKKHPDGPQVYEKFRKDIQHDKNILS